MRARQNKITRIEGMLRTSCYDLLIEERQVRLVVDGRDFSDTVMAPGDEELWAFGHLLSSGLIKRRDDVESLKGGSSIHVTLRRGAAADAPTDARGGWGQVMVSPDVIRDGISWLAEAPLYTATGAAHVAALVSFDGKRLARMEDLGRHNAIDKALGFAVERDLDFSTLLLLFSGRMPEDIVRKAVTAGIPVMASVSAATAQGVAFAETSGITLVGFVREKRMNVYAGADRLA